jgi:hypothetical protein
MFGSGEHGQLGFGDTVDQLRPKMIEEVSNVFFETVESGSIYTAALTDSGELYLWGFGENLFGKEQDNFKYHPFRLQFKHRFTQIACGHAHIVALTGKSLRTRP